MSGMSFVSNAHAVQTLHLHAQTHTGLVRPTNEDAHGLFPQAHLALLADGLGGGNAGEVASAMAVELIGETLGRPGHLPTGVDHGGEAGLLRSEQALRAAVTAANAAIHQHAQSHPTCSGMGTTLVIAQWCGTHLLVGHAGDSRAYLLRANELRVGDQIHRRYMLRALTRDHSTAQREAERQLARGLPLQTTHPDHAPARLTRALGVEFEVVLELHRHRLSRGDLVLLCSDGLTDMVGDAKIESLIHATLDGAPPTAGELPSLAQALTDAALHAGGRDNITVVLGLWS